jgi:hypothetical protein
MPQSTPKWQQGGHSSRICPVSRASETVLYINIKYIVKWNSVMHHQMQTLQYRIIETSLWYLINCHWVNFSRARVKKIILKPSSIISVADPTQHHCHIDLLPMQLLRKIILSFMVWLFEMILVSRCEPPRDLAFPSFHYQALNTVPSRLTSLYSFWEKIHNTMN